MSAPPKGSKNGSRMKKITKLLKDRATYRGSIAIIAVLVIWEAGSSIGSAGPQEYPLPHLGPGLFQRGHLRPGLLCELERQLYANFPRLHSCPDRRHSPGSAHGDQPLLPRIDPPGIRGAAAHPAAGLGARVGHFLAGRRNERHLCHLSGRLFCADSEHRRRGPEYRRALYPGGRLPGGQPPRMSSGASCFPPPCPASSWV